ncbi:LysR family transcriptional regulator [Pseudarthrobacter sp. AL07]|uniref:LysR family transcriptional regulator n=1 Tax=unclassified Pseudarthrobacter TaxID=2647000 RepID=UPI00249AB353|nr:MULTISPECIES: LysR family transcriptional regulator [unclassified Pseudarthrobacter]MDI3196008.1 LysR family transcriptional regulator [Pseudarthrobacter sp. AL20]MDI3210099.1 LysR family transcriptional regulator [Pseudarthrobacter sp. AL07]
MDPKIGLRDLAAVVGVAEAGSFSRAAEALWISRATMTEQVKNVERILGVKLFERTTRSVSPTPAGRVFVDHASRLLIDLSGMQDAVREAGELPRGVVRIGLPAGVVTQRIWYSISGFRRDYPEVELHFVETTIDQLIRSIHKGELDLSVISWPAGEAPSGVRTKELGSTATGVVVSPDHALTRTHPVSSEDLNEFPLVTFVQGFALRAIAEDFCHRAKIEPIIAMESSVDETVAGLVRAQVGYSITTVEQAEREGLAILSTKIASLDRVTGLAWSNRGELASVAAKLRDRIAEGARLGF